MAIEQHIKRGDLCLDEKDFLGAISNYSLALKENPKAFQALLKRSTAYQRLKNLDAAKRDISEAFQVAELRGKRSDIGLCYFRLGLIFYIEKDFEVALKNIQKAEEFDCQEQTLSNWKAKAEYDVKKNASSDKSGSSTSGNTPTSTPTPVNTTTGSTHIDTINKHAPLKVKIRDDWYQSSSAVIITIYAKNINPDTLKIQFSNKSVSISFPSAANSEYNYNLDPLFAEINSTESTFKVYGTKLEITLVKVDKSLKWNSLERSGDDDTVQPIQTSANTDLKQNLPVTAYPTSSKKAVNWSNFKVTDDDDEVDNSESDFFAKLYKDTDDDTRRAMMKSYVESNGTVLTTNWDEAKTKTFETSPPEGMVAKSWEKK